MTGKRTEVWAHALSKQLYATGGPAEEALRAKCNWEHMSRPAVLLEWGDPREWRTVKAQTQAQAERPPLPAACVHWFGGTDGAAPFNFCPWCGTRPPAHREPDHA